MNQYEVNIPIQHKVDGYKLDHISQYVAGTQYVFNNLTPRSNKYAQVITGDGRLVLFGIQLATMKMLAGWDKDFFSQPKAKVIKAFSRRIKNYVGPDKGARAIAAMAELHDLGYLPLEVRALPEGSRVDMRVPVLSVRNTHPNFGWLVNYGETYLSCNLWAMCNSASLSEQYYLNSKKWGEVTGAPAWWLPIANHCFAARGHRNDDDAMMSGMAHLIFSVGTDTLWAIDGIEGWYGGDSDTETIGVSVNAFEHATASQRIAVFGTEKAAFKDAITNIYPTGVLSYVIDTKDPFYFLKTIMRELKEEVLARQPDELGLCKLVLRPDSSRKTPKEIIMGYKALPMGGEEALDAAINDWKNSGGKAVVKMSSEFLEAFKSQGINAVEIKGTHYDAEILGGCLSIDLDNPIPDDELVGALDILWDIYGGETNEKGYRVLNPKVGIIYGESITIEMQDEIYSAMEAAGWCVSNVLMGVGSWAFLCNSSRDSYGIAIKATASVVNDELVEMQKTPKTDSGMKHSAKGLIRVEEVDGKFVAYDQQTPEQYESGALKVIMRDGVLINPTTFKEIRARVGFNI